MLPQAGGPTLEGGGGAGGGAPPVAGSASGGNAGVAGSSGSGGSEPVDPHYKLLWRDDFDTFDEARWSKADHTFEENLAGFSADNVSVAGGFLKLAVTQVPRGNKPYSAAEVYSNQEFTHGRFEARIRFCPGSGMVSSLFTYKEDVDESWQEIDIEHLGNLPKSIQYNLISGTFDSRKYQPKVVTFAYAPTAEFHDHTIEWTPEGITFFVDGVQTHHDVQATIQDAARLRMNVWPTNNQVTSFAGPLDTSAIPCESQYDWVQVFSHTP